MVLKQGHSRLEKKQKQKKQEEHLNKLRQEAYADLHAQLQHYNDEFITRMRYEESLRSVPSTDSLCSTGTEESTMQDLADLFAAGTVKDYSQLIEWESYTVSNSYSTRHTVTYTLGRTHQTTLNLKGNMAIFGKRKISRL